MHVATYTDNVQPIVSAVIAFLSFGWALRVIPGHPWKDFLLFRALVALIVLAGACALSYFLLKGQPLYGILGGLIATLVGWSETRCRARPSAHDQISKRSHTPIASGSPVISGFRVVPGCAYCA